jgi:glycosyltransferase involved in cell wall biosynthesis
MPTPFFSVVLPVYNRENLIEKVVHTVLNQTFKDFELIVVDNFSSDRTIEKIQSLQNGSARTIKLICNSQNLERCVSRNLGINSALGEYICFIDSDDFWIEDHLETLFTTINSQKQVALYFTNAFDSVDFGPLTERICPKLDHYELFHYLTTYTFNPSRVAVHRNILQSIQFDPEIPGLEDFDLWLRIATVYPILQVDKRTVVYNCHNSSTTSNELSQSDNQLKLYRKVLNKKEFCSKINRVSRNRLLSMCYYNLVLSLNSSFQPFLIHYYILKAYFLFPKGYNHNTNKTMCVIFIYQIPFIGFLIKSFRKILPI